MMCLLEQDGASCLKVSVDTQLSKLLKTASVQNWIKLLLQKTNEKHTVNRRFLKEIKSCK